MYALAWGHKEQQRALGAAGACQAVAALLRAPGVQTHAALLEKSLRAVHVLCRHGITLDTRDEANEKALVAAGACEGESMFRFYLYSLSSHRESIFFHCFCLWAGWLQLLLLLW